MKVSQTRGTATGRHHYAGRPVLLAGASSVLAVVAHQSQSADNPVLWRRLELLGDAEYLRVLGP